LKKNILLLIVFILFIAGCGYKPAITYTKKSLNDSFYTTLNFGKNSDGRNSAYLKEHINNLLLTRFHLKLVNQKDLANIIILIKIDDISQKALQTDLNGYVKIYKLTVKTTIKYFKNIKDPKIKIMHLLDYSTYTVNDDSTITTNNKQIAIKNSIDKILETFVSTITINNI